MMRRAGTSWTSADFTANGFKETAFSYLLTVGMEYTLSRSMAIGASVLWDHNTASDFASAELIFSNLTGTGYLKFLF